MKDKVIQRIDNLIAVLGDVPMNKFVWVGKNFSKADLIDNLKAMREEVVAGALGGK